MLGLFSTLGLGLITLASGSMIGVALILFGLLIIQFQFGGNFSVLGDSLWNILNSWVLTALPMFILLGEILAKTGIAERIYTSIAPIFNRLPGQLIQTNIGACTLFSAVSGSSQATSAVVGSIAYGELVRRKYSPKWIAGSIAAGGTLGILIPPSLPFIIYGWWQEVSIGKLFVAGIVPGLLLASMFMLYIGISAKLRPEQFPAPERRVPLGRALLMSMNAWPFLALIFAVLGTLVMGLATPTESAALGAAAALVLAVAYRQFSLRMLWAALMDTVLIMSTISLVIVGATVLSQAMALSGIPAAMAKAVSASGLPPIVILLGIYLLYIVLGCVLAAIEMMLITLPFTFPLVVAIGYDPVWFGVALVLLIEIGLLTPPVGMNMFIVVAISRGEMSLGQVARACVPFWLIQMSLLALVTIFPEIVLFLPDLLF
ncbi:MAG: TRAP transporter large permease [Burkholderiales bacterium]|nr:TRAP transporter large permease [Burkholderiales bacterium]